MKYIEVINKKILKLEKDKSEILRDLYISVSFFNGNIKEGYIDYDTFKCVTELINGVSTIDKQLQLLYDIRKETSNK